MCKFSILRTSATILIAITFATSAFAQLCGPPLYPPCPTPTPAPSPAPAPAPSPSPAPPPATTPAPAPAPPPATTPPPAPVSPPATTPPSPAPTLTPPPAPTPAPTAPSTAPSAQAGATVTSVSSVSNIPGYAPSRNYSAGKTAAYIIAPFAIVAGTYFLGHQHQIEISPNAGFFWPSQTDTARLRDEGIYGVKASAGVTESILVEGNFSYINHFESRFAPTDLDQSFGIPVRTVHGLLYDVNGVYDFGRHPIFGSRVSPYATFGLGGLSTEVRRGSAAVLGGQIYTTDSTGAVVLDSDRKVIVADNTPFFSINYGAGVKATNLWGPAGVRFDVRGRTFPNFRGEALTWLETTAGVTFTFGQH
jgi:hypothetical protein